MASNLRVDTILPSSGTNVAIGTASGTVSLLGNSNIITSGNATIGGNLGVGGVLTYEDVTNIDSVGVITARSGVNVSGGEIKVGAAVTVSSGGVITSGIVTATSFSGSGANLTGISGGKILQVQSTTRTDTFSESVATGAISADAITVNITPSNASNKIFLIAHLSIGLSNDNEVNWAFYKGGSVLSGAIAGADGNRRQRTSAGDVRWTGTHNTTGGQYLDTAGGTSQITYSCRLGHGNNGAVTIYLNQSHTDDNYAYDFRTISTLTAMEVES
tara:strand:- start:1183 stop:2001 length:819 start_codon:yes stop_codon:yes gene_type:complete